ncbi:GLPGLI family protein [Porphyromonas levii]|uniref:GLPGLI family protein n=1 Tax=Porphyromonas levii TaxID=28114 RepID=UPI001B8ACD00|nr:GLPGLI family protein [Porphyromonas levii]MBR8712657.1 hypothetical protein [Porphyromonas levii]MBR8714729.1 hypothetical protein [Porphyromonas levii]MBR8727213.1 hypothetical protein [Porphyromonas levii]MBR8731947.1 hypothetical protein [Porphyromonas levii]MBR8735352.1 hypothetical protein [Porphyromonas levii]
MKKLLVGLLFLMVGGMPSFAQKKMMYGVVTQIDTSKLIYYYIYSFNEAEREGKARMVLQVGDKLQRFSSMENYLSDSLALTFNNEPQDTKLLLQRSMELRRSLDFRGDVRWVLYTNYPIGKRSITDRVFMDRFLTEEKDVLPEWQLVDEQKEIAGRLCSKATTTLYGRKWVVWYSEKESRPDGPWLLRGLPGVVVLAKDSTGDFSFELYKIEHRSTPILYGVRDYFKASRNDVLKAMKRYYDNMAQYVAATAAGQQTSDLPKTDPINYNPLRKIKE